VLADEAVALDSSFTWIYASFFRWDAALPRRQEWLTRLRDYDPNNAVPDLVAAQLRFDKRYMTLLDRRSATEEAIEASFESDPELFAMMEHAVRAQTYDNYFSRRMELFREMCGRRRALSPGVLLFSAFPWYLPPSSELNIYAQVLTRHAGDASSQQAFDAATNSLERLMRLGENMKQAGQLDYEYSGALVVRKAALEGLKKAFASSGRARESAAADLRLQPVLAEKERLDKRWANQISQGLENRPPWYIRNFRREASIVHALALFVVLNAVLVLLSIGLLESRMPSRWKWWVGWQKLFCRFADFGPAMLLVAGTAFVWSYQPFARTLEVFLSPGTGVPNSRALWDTLGSLFYVPQRAMQPFGFLFIPFYQCVIATALLSTLWIIILLRGLLRYSRLLYIFVLVMICGPALACRKLSVYVPRRGSLPC
jgi:hypothetical protein